MSAFYDNNITDAGRLLLAEIQSGAKFVPTKIVIGSGYMPQGKTTRTMTDVAEVVKELSLNKIQKTSDGSVIFGASFSNEDILEPFYYRELGLYVKGVYYNAEGEPSNETEEVLYSYGNAGDNAELIPAYSEGSITERQLDLIVYIGNDTEVVVNIESGMYVTMPVFTEQIENINKEIITIKADFGDIDDKIGNTTDCEATVSTGTVFGKLNGILSYLTVTLVNKLSEIIGYITENKIYIGNPEDVSTSPTIFGRLAEIKETLTSKFGEVVSKITRVDEKIGTTTDTGATLSTGSMMGKLNKIIDEAITLEDIYGKGAEYTSPGTYTLEIPPSVKQMKVTACGGGGGGQYAYPMNGDIGAGGGGGGGAAINQKLYSITEGTILNITIGKGGNGGKGGSTKTNATAGSSTVIEGIVTLAGGGAGTSSRGNLGTGGGTAGGTGGGKGGGAGTKGSDGLTGTGGITYTTEYEQYKNGGGGGGSIGNGGAATKTNGNNGIKGGGGAGGGGEHYNSTSNYSNGGNGGDGYCKIEWIW